MSAAIFDKNYSLAELEAIFTEMAKPVWTWLVVKGPNPFKSKEQEFANVSIFPEIHVVRDGHCAVDRGNMGKHTLAHTQKSHITDRYGNRMLVTEKGFKYSYLKIFNNKTQRREYRWQETPHAEPISVNPHICLRKDIGGTSLKTLIHEMTHARGFNHRVIRGLRFSRYAQKDEFSEHVLNLVYPVRIINNKGPLTN